MRVIQLPVEEVMSVRLAVARVILRAQATVGVEIVHIDAIPIYAKTAGLVTGHPNAARRIFQNVSAPGMASSFTDDDALTPLGDAQAFEYTPNVLIGRHRHPNLSHRQAKLRLPPRRRRV
ncbi:hypothetical protein PSAC2689_20510 [Paraburkholderia sacchari]|uniref:hypothetical protein n=1 Tax=Paraburkholderia sacchari TaxID=159450 RepID=UPI0039A56679